MTIHDFDMARFLAQSEIVEMCAFGSCLLSDVFKKYEDIDTACIQLKFANSCLGIIDNSRRAVYGYDQRVEVFGSEGSLSVNHLKENNVEIYLHNALYHAPLQNFFLNRYEKAFVEEVKAFFKSVATNARTEVDGHDGLQALKCAIAAKKSHLNGQIVKL